MNDNSDKRLVCRITGRDFSVSEALTCFARADLFFFPNEGIYAEQVPFLALTANQAAEQNVMAVLRPSHVAKFNPNSYPLFFKVDCNLPLLIPVSDAPVEQDSLQKNYPSLESYALELMENLREKNV